MSDLETGSVLVPTALGTPDAAYVSKAVPGRVSLVYEPGPGVPRSPYTDVGILVTQYPASLNTEEYISKLAGAGTKVERVTVDGSPGLWLEDGPHFVFFRTPDGRLTDVLELDDGHVDRRRLMSRSRLCPGGCHGP